MPATVISPIIAGDVLAAGLRSDFWDMWIGMSREVEAAVKDVMQLGVPSDKLTEIYGYFESSPYPVRWPRGTPISSDAIDSVAWNVTNLDWGRRVGWHVNDRMDDQTQSLYEAAQGAGEHWATLPERILFQIMTGGTDPDLLPSIPLDPTGVPLYSTTGPDALPRFGTPTLGNSVPTSGVDSAEEIERDYIRVMSQFRLFRNTKGQPLWNDRVLDGGVTIFYNAQNQDPFWKAFSRGRTVATIQNVAGTENVGGATPTNVILESGQKVTLRPTQRIVDDSWYVFLNAAPRKAIFQQERQPVFETIATWETSDHTRNTGEEYIQWKSREGYGIAVPYQTIKVAA